MRVLICLAVLALMVTTVGCIQAPCGVVRPGIAILYADYKAPIDGDADPTMKAPKVGEAYVENIIGLIQIGDASIEAAAKAGQIRKIHYVDYHYKSILGVYVKFTTLVYGE